MGRALKDLLRQTFGLMCTVFVFVAGVSKVVAVAIVSDVFLLLHSFLEWNVFFGVVVFHTILVVANVPDVQLLLLLLCWLLELVCVVIFPSVVVIAIFPHGPFEKQGDLGNCSAVGNTLQLEEQCQTWQVADNIIIVQQTVTKHICIQGRCQLYKMPYETNKYLFSYLSLGIFSKET